MLICSALPVAANALRNEISQALGTRGLNLLWRIKDEQVEVVFLPNTDATNVLRTIKREVPGTPMRAAVGQLHEGLAGLQRSRREARQALLIQERLGLDGDVAEFDRLGIYRLLFAAESLPESAEFHRATLGELAAARRPPPRRTGSRPSCLVWRQWKPQVAAERLGVHRNTVLYRLTGLPRLSGYDLDEADTRLRLQLALAIDTIATANPDRERSGV